MMCIRSFGVLAIALAAPEYQEENMLRPDRVVVISFWLFIIRAYKLLKINQSSPAKRISVFQELLRH